MNNRLSDDQAGRGTPHFAAAAIALLLLAPMLAGTVSAQEVRYSWFELGVLGQDISQTGSQFDLGLNQSVDIDAGDGGGVRFRGSLGTWRNFYAFFDFTTADPDVDAVVTNPQGEFPASDRFDFTQVRAGLGYAWALSYRTHILGEFTYDSVDYDFGSFAGEDFDLNEADIGAALGVRTMLSDEFELRAFARYTNVGEADLTNGVFDSDTLFSIGAGYEFVRGLSINFDYETGEVETYSVGFRLDLDED